ncbi:hypothetical protein [Myxococcus sp. CA040A]|uniref:hypothetical protein n=1 Tax=Myxococcus sp. CA040A TaxID=2741738 RepID=UPI00157A94B0|nr:hypothetical protein [Myxococcus sp. CA040A]NTX01953.1 hypothetical protein [Myxococcus sp. CA040A]
MAEVSGRARDWASAQELGFERGTVAAAWPESDDPLAMLLLLAALHPRREEERCLEVATALSFFEPMRVQAHTMRRWRSSIPTNGQSPFYVMRLYQLLRAAFPWVKDTKRSRLDPELAPGIRAVIEDPYTLVAPAAWGPG